MNYDEMLQGLARAGHDISGYKRPPMTTKSDTARRKPEAALVTLALDDIASVIDDAIAPLEERIATLEEQVAELQAAKSRNAVPKQVVRIAAGRRIA